MTTKNNESDDSIIGMHVRRPDYMSAGYVVDVIEEHDAMWNKHYVWILTDMGHKIFIGKVAFITDQTVQLKSF